MRKSVVPTNPHHAVYQLLAELSWSVAYKSLDIECQWLNLGTAYEEEEEEELYGWEYGEDSALPSLVILCISCFIKCPYSEGTEGGGWM